MDIKVKTIDGSDREYIEIGCHRVNERVNEIVRFIKLRQGSIEVTREEKIYQIPVQDILYIESIDDRSFIYLRKDCYESRRRLYEFEQILPADCFARISKSAIVNLMKVRSIRPALNGRFMCQLVNDEKIIISRKYVPEINERLKG